MPSVMLERIDHKIYILGSLEFFSDEFFQAEVDTGNGKPVPSGNFELAEALSLWCFKVVKIYILDGYWSKMCSYMIHTSHTSGAVDNNLWPDLLAVLKAPYPNYCSQPTL